MLSIRARIFAVASIIILLILGVSIMLVVISKKNQTPAGNEQNTTGTLGQGDTSQNTAIFSGGNNATPVPSGVKVIPPTAEDVEKNAVKQFAKIFIERYGSYSTDSNFQNIRDVEFLVTESLWQKLSSQIGRISGDKFVGVTTGAVSAEVAALDGDSARVNMSVVQEEDKDGTVTTASKNVIVYMMKVSGSWLVDKFEWQ